MPRKSGQGWIKVYPPGEYRGRDGWHVRGRDIHGRPIEGRLPSAVASDRAAERVAHRLLDDANRRAPDPAPDPTPVDDKPDHSFEAAAKAYRRIQRPRQVEWDRIEKLIACPEIGPVDVAELTTDQAATFAAATKPGCKPDTWNREIITPYSAVLHYAYEIKWIDDPLIRRFQEQEDENVAVTPGEVDLLVANVDRTGTYKAGAHGLKDRNAAYKVALLEYLRLRGTRITDTLGIKRGRDLDLPGNRVRLTIGKRRDLVKWLPLSPAVVALFANLAPCEGDYLFPWRSKSGVYKWFKPLTRSLGLEGVTPHQFRHALGEEMIDAGTDLLTLKGTMGAASLNSVRRYARPSMKRLREVDQLRAREARGGQHREMVAGDFEFAADNVVPLRKTGTD